MRLHHYWLAPAPFRIGKFGYIRAKTGNEDKRVNFVGIAGQHDIDIPRAGCGAAGCRSLRTGETAGGYGHTFSRTERPRHAGDIAAWPELFKAEIARERSWCGPRACRMATTKKPDSEWPCGAGGKGVCSICPNGLGETESPPQLLQHLLRTHDRARYGSRNQVGIAGVEDVSPRLVKSAQGAAYAHSRRFHCDTNAIRHACAQAAGT